MKENKKNVFSYLKEIVGLLLLMLFLFFLKSNIGGFYKVPTCSMEPTIYSANNMGQGFGDHLIVWDSAYGFNSRIKIPFINWYYPLPKYRFMVPGMRFPEVGDVIVFENPHDYKMDYIKRCAGTPGDKIKILNGKLYVNDKIITNSPAQADYVYYSNRGILGDFFKVVKFYVENISNFEKNDSIKDSILINGKPYREIEKEINNKTSSINPIFDTIVSEVIVPTNCYFMLGDNSAFSADSRYWGFVPFDLIKGKALCVYLPLKRIRIVR